MKNLILLVTLLTSLSALARTPKRFLDADILTSRFDQESPLAQMDIRHAHAQIDFVQDQISLVFTLPWNCPANALCALVMPTRTFTVQYITSEIDECNIISYTAESDKRPVDGSYERITIRDLSRSTCPRIMIYPPLHTTIEYEVKFHSRLQGKEVHYKHFFTAEKLK